MQCIDDKRCFHCLLLELGRLLINKVDFVVFSKVHTLAGLFLCEKLDENRSFFVDEDLLKEEERLAQIENAFLQNIEFTHWDEVNSAN